MRDRGFFLRWVLLVGAIAWLAVGTLLCANARAQDGGIAHSAVNTPEGVKCSALFDGGAGLCFPQSAVREVVETLRNRPACVADKVALGECKIARNDLGKAITGLDAEVSIHKERAGLLQLALDAEKRSAADLKSALTSTKWKWFWSVTASFVGAAALGYVAGHFLK